jgi:AcrR family transcriptional regulator
VPFREIARVLAVERPNAKARRRTVGAGGKRLDAARDAVILHAALDGLAESGYDRLTMEDIAARAHAGKGALYRRWSSKEALVIDAVEAWRKDLAPINLPDTGSLQGDVEAIVAAVPDFDDSDHRQMAVIMGLASAALRDPRLMAALSESILDDRRKQIRQVLDRAVERGEIPRQRNLDLVPDVIFGLNILRVLSGKTLDRAFIREVFHQVVQPLVTAPVQSDAT